MSINSFKTIGAARRELEKNGFTFSHRGLDRQYWVHTDKSVPEVFLDHSATLKRVGKTYYVSMFFPAVLDASGNKIRS